MERLVTTSNIAIPIALRRTAGRDNIMEDVSSGRGSHARDHFRCEDQEKIIVLRYDAHQRGWLDPARTAITAAICIGLQYPYIPCQIFGEKGCQLGRDITGNEAGSARPLVLQDLISAVVTTCKLGLQSNEVCDHV